MPRRNQIDVVLVSPRNPLNIGAVARAMANFGFERLSVAAAYSPNWREAKSAVGAPDLLTSARECATLAHAVSACTFVVGTGTLTHRKPEQPVISLPDLGPLMQREIANGGHAALVFGPEKHGLTREDLSYCHVLVEIPTDPRQPSMNLGQAAAVCLYELVRTVGEGESGLGEVRSIPPFRREAAERMGHPTVDVPDAKLGRVRGLPPFRPSAGERVGHPGFDETNAVDKAKSGALERLADLIEEVMLAANYSPESMRDANRHDLRVVLRRLAPTAHDTRRMMGLFRRVLRQLTLRLHSE